MQHYDNSLIYMAEFSMKRVVWLMQVSDVLILSFNQGIHV